MIPITSFAEKSDQASRFFVLNRSLRRFTPALRDGDPILCFCVPALKPPAYYQSASPRRRRFDSPPYLPRVPCTVVAVLKALYTYGVTPPGNRSQ